MKQSYKAALLSALVYPGSGHFLLKRHWTGAILAAATTACLVALILRALQIARAISERLLNGELAPDLDRIMAEVSVQSAAADSYAVTISVWLLAACWVGGSIDAFRLGRQADRAAKSGGRQSISGERYTAVRLDDTTRAGRNWITLTRGLDSAPANYHRQPT